VVVALGRAPGSSQIKSGASCGYGGVEFLDGGGGFETNLLGEEPAKVLEGA
jgi:hypothetical protein